MSTDECVISPAIVRTACVGVLALASFVNGRAVQAAPANHDCPAADNRTWVQGDGECLYIRTFDRDKTVPAPLLLVFLHGDKSNGRPISWEIRYADQFASANVVAVAMLRPGYPAEDGNRSTGDTSRSDNYTEHNITAVAGALRRLKEYHLAQRLILVGYSGGAAMAGVIIGKFPGLVNVAVLVACPCDVAWRGLAGRRKSLSPADFIGGIAAGTQVLAMTGQRDTNTFERLARDYVARLRARNIAAEFRQIPDADHDNTPNKPETVSAIQELLKQQGTGSAHGLVQADPIILSRDDIGDTYHVVPADLLGPKTWLGLFVTGTESRVEGRVSRLRVTRVRVVTRRESGQTIHRIVTTPPGASLLVSAVPGVSAGPAVTAGVFVDLGSEMREAAFRLGKQLYTIRLDSTVPDHCDGVITLTSGGRMQRLFDATQPGATRQPGLVVACDDPHFKIHWAGDLDRDGRLDLLVTFSHKYSYFPTRLLLSSAALPQDLVGEVATHERFAE